MPTLPIAPPLHNGQANRTQVTDTCSRVQCLSSRVSRLSIHSGRTLHPSRVLVPGIGKQLRPKQERTQLSLSRKLSSVSLSEKQENYINHQILQPSSKLIKNSNMCRRTISSQRSCKTYQLESKQTSDRPTDLSDNNKTHSKNNSITNTKCNTFVDLSHSSCSSFIENIVNTKLNDHYSDNKPSLGTGNPCQILLAVQPVIDNAINTGKQTCQLLQSRIMNRNEFSSNSNVTQLLHPDWRKVPWRSHFGWTDDHRKLCKLLQQRAKNGGVESIYYKSPEEHMAAGMTWRYHNRGAPFLSGPTANSVSEVLEVLRRISRTRPHHVTRPNTQLVTNYDADDEDLIQDLSSD